MATRKPTFSIQLDDIPEPRSYEKAGALVAQAGQLEGEAKVLGAKGETGFLSTVGQIARGVVVGVGEAEIEEKTKEAIERYEDSPKITEGREADIAVSAYDARQKELASPGDTPAEDPSITELRKKAQAFRVAQDQGLLTRNEVLTRVEDVVKQWSARLPGLQSEFRKVAANETGINNIDIYRVHQSLTTESERQKALQRDAIAMEKYRERVSIWMGIPPSEVTAQDASRFHMFTQLEQNAKRVETEAKLSAANADTRASALDPVIQNRTAADLTRLSSMFSIYNKLNEDPSKASERDSLMVQMSNEVVRMRTEADVYFRTEAARYGLDNKLMAPRLQSIKESYDGMEALLKTKGGVDVLKTIIGRREDEAKDMLRRFELANPALTIMGKINVADKLFPLWVEKGPEGLMKAHGMSRDMAYAYDNAFKNINQWSRGYERLVDPAQVKSFGVVDFNGPEGRQYSPDQKKAGLADGQGKFTEAVRARDQATPQEAEVGMNGLHLWTTNIRPNEKEMIGRFNNMVEAPAVDAFLATRPAIERRAVAEPVFRTLVPAVRSKAATVQSNVAALNEVAASGAVPAEWQAAVVADPSGTLSIEWTRGDVREATVMTPAGAQMTALPAQAALTAPPSFAMLGIAGQSALSALEAEVKDINLYISALDNAHRIRGDSPDMTKSAIGDAVASAITDGSDLPPLSPAEKQASERQTQKAELATRAPVDEEHVAVSLRTAEGTNEGKHLGDSGKGTLGAYQLKEEAVIDVLKNKYDPAKKDFYRTDPLESKRIAVAYWDQQLKTFGDPLKAAAAYNWGPTNLRKHLVKAERTGRDWRLGLPAETKRYVAKFAKPYSTYEPVVQ